MRDDFEQFRHGRNYQLVHIEIRATSMSRRWRAKLFFDINWQKQILIGNSNESFKMLYWNIFALGKNNLKKAFWTREINLVTASSRTLETYGILLSLKILRWSLLGVKDIKVYNDDADNRVQVAAINNTASRCMCERSWYQVNFQSIDAKDLQRIELKNETFKMSKWKLC